MSLKEKILTIGKDSSWYLAAQGGYALMGLLSVPILTRIFTPDQYGIYSLVSVTIVLVGPIFYITFTTSIIRFHPEYDNRKELDTLYSTALRYMPHFLVLIVGVALPLAIFVIPLGSNRSVICLGIAVFALFVPFLVLLTLFQAGRRARTYSILFLTVYAGRYLVGAALAKWAGAGVNGVFIGWLAALLLVVPLELFLLRVPRMFRWQKYSSSLMKQFMSYGFVLIFVNISVNILTTSDRYLVQAFKGSKQVGLYSVVYTLVVDAFTMILSALQLGAAPVIMQTYENEGDEATSALLSRITRLLLIALIPSAVGLYLLRVRVIHVLTSAKYLPATKAILPLTLAIFLYNLAWIPAYAFFVKKRTTLTLIPVVASALLNIGLNLFLIPRYGFVGAAWSTMIAYVLYLIMIVAMSERLLHWQFPYLAILKALAASVVMGATVYGLNRLQIGGFVGLLLCIAGGIVVYILAMLAFRGVTRSELEFASDTMKKLIGRAEPPSREDD